MSGARRRLPDRRDSTLVNFEHAGLRYTVGFSHFADGTLGEIFLDCDRRGSAAEVAGRDGAVLASICLQHVVAADEIRHSLLKLKDGSPAGPVGRALEIASGAA
jgi:hypothetical protein